MKITLNDEEKKQSTALEDDASIYSARDERTAVERLKSYKGKEKIQYFCTYFLKKIIAIIIACALVVSLVYTIFFKKRMIPACSLYVINSPFTYEAVETMRSDLTELYVTNPEDEEVVLDDQYWFTSDDYQSRMVFVTRIANGEVNLVVLDLGEFETQVDNEVIIPVKDALTEDVYKKLEDYYCYATPVVTEASGTVVKDEDVYGLNISKYLMKVNNTDRENKNYCIGFLGNAKNPLDNEKLVKYMFPEAFN